MIHTSRGLVWVLGSAVLTLWLIGCSEDSAELSPAPVQDGGDGTGGVGGEGPREMNSAPAEQDGGDGTRGVYGSDVDGSVEPGAGLMPGMEESCAQGILVLPGEVRLLREDVVTLTAYDICRAVGSVVSASSEWRSSRPKVVAVNDLGQIAGRRAGQAQVTATRDGQQDTVTVEVVQPPLNLTHNETVGTLGIDLLLSARSQDLAGAEVDVTSDVTWHSDNPGISVDTGGVVSGTTPGTALITATYRGLSEELTVLMKVPGPTLSATPASLAIPLGGSGWFTVQKTRYDGITTDVTEQVTYSVRDPNIASVVEGEVTALSVGETVVLAELSGQSVEILVNVTPRELLDVSFLLPESILLTGMTYEATTTAYYSDGAEEPLFNEVLVWRSANPDVATVAGGFVTAVGNGQTVITAETADGRLTAERDVSVGSGDPYAIHVVPTVTTLAVGETVAFTARVLFTDGTEYDWTSSASWSVTPLDETGAATLTEQFHSELSVVLLTATAPGTVSVTADLGFLSSTFTVTIAPEP